jgi:hypothetical protein
MPDLNATITGVRASFFTHNDNKDHDTSVSVFVQNRVNMFLAQDIARLEHFAGNTEFGDDPPSTHGFDLGLASDNIRLSELNLPTFRITVAPVGDDRWIFDVTLTIAASDGSQSSSTTTGIILDQDNRIFNGVFSSS